MGIIIAVSGLLVVLSSAIAWSFRAVREVESILPDHEVAVAAPPPASGRAPDAGAAASAAAGPENPSAAPVMASTAP